MGRCRGDGALARSAAGPRQLWRYLRSTLSARTTHLIVLVWVEEVRWQPPRASAINLMLTSRGEPSVRFYSAVRYPRRSAALHRFRLERACCATASRALPRAAFARSIRAFASRRTGL